MALSPKEKKELQQRFEKQLLPDLDMSFELNGEVYKFNFDKNESGDYIDSFTEPRQPGGCKLKTAPVRPVVAARPAEYVCSEALFY